MNASDHSPRPTRPFPFAAPKCLLLLLIGALLPAGGCGQPVGWLIRPVPLDAALDETVIARDPGLFVTDKIVVVDLDGLLLNQRQGGLLGSGENPVSLFVEKLDKAAADRNVRALVLRINSPGGGVTASDIMYRRLKRFRAERDVPVIAVIEDVGASGGYYVACAADAILVHPTSVTGSIGVMIQTVSFAGTLQKLGIDARAVVSRPRKDLANPLAPLREEDLAILQGIVNEYYERFLAVVGEAREEIGPDRLREIADGRVYTGEQAIENGLADEIGYVPDAIALAKRRSGAGRVRVVMYHRPYGYRANAYSAVPGPVAEINLLRVDLPSLQSLARPEFLYLWTGRAGR